MVYWWNNIHLEETNYSLFLLLEFSSPKIACKLLKLMESLLPDWLKEANSLPILDEVNLYELTNFRMVYVRVS
jgi:hypothetical protein